MLRQSLPAACADSASDTARLPCQPVNGLCSERLSACGAASTAVSSICFGLLLLSACELVDGTARLGVDSRFERQLLQDEAPAAWCTATRAGWSDQLCELKCATIEGGCPDSLCDCELNSDGEAMEASFPAGGRVCYTITVKDRHAHILVELNTTSEIALQALLLTASDDGSRRFPSLDRYDMQVTNGTVGLLDRDTWRRENGRLDEGEWVGQWTICVQQSSGGPVDDSGLITFRLAVIVSRCPTSRDGGTCSGHGTCDDIDATCTAAGTEHKCTRPVCTCQCGWRGEDCNSPESCLPPGVMNPEDGNSELPSSLKGANLSSVSEPNETSQAPMHTPPPPPPPTAPKTPNNMPADTHVEPPVTIAPSTLADSPGTWRASTPAATPATLNSSTPFLANTDASPSTQAASLLQTPVSASLSLPNTPTRTPPFLSSPSTVDSSEKRAVNSGRAPNLGHVLDVNDEVQNGAFTSHADDKHWGKANLLLAVIGGLLFLAAGVTMLLHSRRRNRLSTGIGANGKHGGKGELAMMPLLRSSNHDM